MHINEGQTDQFKERLIEIIQLDSQCMYVVYSPSSLLL